jgi:hypothetical protein
MKLVGVDVVRPVSVVWVYWGEFWWDGGTTYVWWDLMI